MSIGEDSKRWRVTVSVERIFAGTAPMPKVFVTAVQPGKFVFEAHYAIVTGDEFPLDLPGGAPADPPPEIYRGKRLYYLEVTAADPSTQSGKITQLDLAQTIPYQRWARAADGEVTARFYSSRGRSAWSVWAGEGDGEFVVDPPERPWELVWHVDSVGRSDSRELAIEVSDSLGPIRTRLSNQGNTIEFHRYRHTAGLGPLTVRGEGTWKIYLTAEPAEGPAGIGASDPPFIPMRGPGEYAEFSLPEDVEATTGNVLIYEKEDQAILEEPFGRRTRIEPRLTVEGFGPGAFTFFGGGIVRPMDVIYVTNGFGTAGRFPLRLLLHSPSGEITSTDSYFNSRGEFTQVRTFTNSAFKEEGLYKIEVLVGDSFDWVLDIGRLIVIPLL